MAIEKQSIPPSDSVPPKSDRESPHAESHSEIFLRTSISAYKITGALGNSGESSVWRAVQLSTGRKVAVKLMREWPADKRSRDHFSREAHILAKLDHPNIVSVIDEGMAPNGAWFIVMDHISGRPLDNYLWDQADPKSTLRIFYKICMAVNEAHLRGIIHHDLEPRNVLIDERGEPHIKDFGLALMAPGQFYRGTKKPIDDSEKFLGSLPWASPEQVSGGNVDIRSDVYSLGIILYQILTNGRFPYEAIGTAHDVLNNIVTSIPTPLKKMIAVLKSANLRGEKIRDRAAWPRVIEAIVMKAMAKQPEHRYQSAGEFARDIDAFLSGMPTTVGEIKSPNFMSRVVARLFSKFRQSGKQQSRTVDTGGKRFHRPSKWPTISTIKMVYETLPTRAALPDWDTLTPDRQDWFAEKIIAAALDIPKTPGEITKSLTFDAQTVAAIQRIPTLLEQLIAVLSKPPGTPPPPNEQSSEGWDDDELRQIWVQLAVEQRAILKLIRRAGDTVLTYKVISSNLVLPRLPGDGRRTEIISDRTVAKHCQPMEIPPLSLIRRASERSAIQLTAKGDRLVRLHSRKDFS